MKLSVRLLFLLIFIGFVLPKMLPHLGYRQVQNLQQKENDIRQQYDDQVTAKKNKFSASIDRLGISDKGLKNCLIGELDFFARMSPSSSSAISDIDELEALRCDARGIRSLDGIDGLTGLTQLSLIRNDIKSLYPLRYHPNLVSIDLSENNRINSIDVLATIKTLKRVSFPDLDNAYCNAAQEVADAMEKRHGTTARSNIDWIDCRGKADGSVARLLLKQRRGEYLTPKEQKLVDDYNKNKRGYR